MKARYIKNIKPWMARRSAPLARVLLRNLPYGIFKKSIYAEFRWQEFLYKATIINGIKIFGDTRDVIQNRLYWFGVWEPALTQVILSRMARSNGRVFVDIGANIGYYSLIVAQQNPNSEVLAIEGFPETFEKLKRNLEINSMKNIVAHGLALAEEEKMLSFYYSGNENIGASTTLPGRFDAIPVEVPAKPIDMILTDAQVSKLRLVKIDVEGAELSVLKGFSKSMHKMPSDSEFIIEITENSGEVFEFMHEFGYKAYEIENDYGDEFYMSTPDQKKLKRLTNPPKEIVDVLFTKLNLS